MAPTGKPQNDPLVEKALKDFPPAWIPKEAGENIVGAFIELTVGPTPFGDKPIVVLQPDDGDPVSVWLLSEVLHNQFLTARPAAGERVAVVYKGKRLAKNPTPGRSPEYHDFRVVVDRTPVEGEDAAVTWDSLTPAAEPEADAYTDEAVPEQDAPDLT